jgi:hypothetical protein
VAWGGFQNARLSLRAAGDVVGSLGPAVEAPSGPQLHSQVVQHNPRQCRRRRCQIPFASFPASFTRVDTPSNGVLGSLSKEIVGVSRLVS